MKNFLQMFRNPKFTGLVFLALIVLVGLPVTLYEVQQQQEVRQHASTGRFYAGLPDSCNHLSFNLPTESPTCNKDGSVHAFADNPNVTQYSTKFRAYWDPTGVTQSSAPTIHFTLHRFYCPHGGGCVPGSPGVIDTTYTKDVSISQWTSAHYLDDITVPFSTPNNKACGSIQIDLEFSYTFGGQNCFSITTNKQPGGYAAYGYCQFWSQIGSGGVPIVDCSVQQVTPTPTPTSGVTPPTSTPTQAITPTDTPTQGITPTDTPTDTPTPGLTTTPTATPNPSNTPSPTQPNQPTDTPTAIITPSTPKPTLPPTGPGNTILGVGLVGIAITVLGLVAAIGL